jgi:L-aspartate oxidase
VSASARRAGLDPRAPLPVTPAQHYTMGGVATDVDGRSSLPGLYACGEVAGTGLHGANRLASNSLLEAMVLGARIARVLRSDDARTADLAAARRPHRPSIDGPLGVDDPAAVSALRTLLWTHAGPVRHADGLRAGLSALAALAPRLERGPDGRTAALVAEVVLRAALVRTESRGAHHRSDHPRPDPAQAAPTFVRHEPHAGIVREATS